MLPAARTLIFSARIVCPHARTLFAHFSQHSQTKYRVKVYMQAPVCLVSLAIVSGILTELHVWIGTQQLPNDLPDCCCCNARASRALCLQQGPKPCQRTTCTEGEEERGRPVPTLMLNCAGATRPMKLSAHLRGLRGRSDQALCCRVLPCQSSAVRPGGSSLQLQLADMLSLEQDCPSLSISWQSSAGSQLSQHPTELSCPRASKLSGWRTKFESCLATHLLLMNSMTHTRCQIPAAQG